jgi:hypothetical protein
LYGPISVEVKKLAYWTVLNANNGKPDTGAVFDYSRALGDFQLLQPGELSEPVKWRFKYTRLGSSPNIESEVTGYIAQKKTK